MSIKITNEMFRAAAREAEKRERQGHIIHHFSLEHMSDWDRNVLGFLGEFAGRQALGVDWRKGIRKDYLTIDDGDVIFDQQVVDIKTETIPRARFWPIIKNQFSDEEPYGRRLICEDQVELLSKYNYVVWCAFIREEYARWIETGYPDGDALPSCYVLGYLDTEHIRKHYSVQSGTPFGTRYPKPCLPVRTSELKPIVYLKPQIRGCSVGPV